MSFYDAQAPLWPTPLPILMQTPSLVWNGRIQQLDKSKPWHGHPIADSLWIFQKATHQKWVGPSSDLTETGLAVCVLDSLHQRVPQLADLLLRRLGILLLNQPHYRQLPGQPHYQQLLGQPHYRLGILLLSQLHHRQLDFHHSVRQKYPARHRP